MASADILRAARARIEDPKNWTAGQFARTLEGHPVTARSKKAVCWCALGAVAAEADGNDERLAALLLFKSSEALFGEEDISIVNDGCGHEAVLKVFDAAIAVAEAEAGR
ncbi:hypothetical protein LNAOJCKE_0912 [Methylorubrum aminovorans]|uniref:Integron gene cassette protein n=1 Tax=Methylorubrum aminovorans TaxID=269069 RepID=A0ABQ4U8Y4_9HYPH|nr:hypothetical protein [Methylorubrum aminovorans]GJE63714.1 hypothetical protein LNAOJCKE_0912 [Methylorubrum aminovorans]GMA73645.1 hypothetical protein GCM10025880_00620 [Methylorubrum aminovorans]GMA79831.1 hypothetical protein GCM10025880_62480 [Methylorubrum aminovorans]